ncbi:hypothetical protein EVAR_56992_1 [Eumeta japonica]|uniref:Uncharacterized protein n=1 Tax=Eumeta variegata TaxID=151549 RepID=A0A4C1ZA76_EUMVA|nr:hypothetical protein EVAR_56992_1 [Eumeta japonica]
MRSSSSLRLPLSAQRLLNNSWYLFRSSRVPFAVRSENALHSQGIPKVAGLFSEPARRSPTDPPAPTVILYQGGRAKSFESNKLKCSISGRGVLPHYAVRGLIGRLQTNRHFPIYRFSSAECRYVSIKRGKLAV